MLLSAWSSMPLAEEPAGSSVSCSCGNRQLGTAGAVGAFWWESQ